MKTYQYITYYIKYLQYLVKLAIWKVRHGRPPSPPTTYLPLYQRKKFLAATFFLIFIAPVIIYLGLKAAKTAEAAWFDESYSYRQPFSFTHDADIDAQRAITFSLDTAELITDGVMQSDCDDTRFTDINGKLLKYELTGACNNAATTYEVIFESIINGSNVGYVYYGNSSAVSASIDSSGYTALTPSGGDPSITTRTNEEQSPGPIAYWKFDEGADNTCSGGTNDTCDSTTNANDGAITGATWQTEDMCIDGKCLYFDGSADNVSISSAINISPNPGFTISHWIRTSSTGGQVYTVGNAGSGDGYRFGITAGKIAFLVGNSGGWDETLCGTNTVNDNKWHLITGIYTTSSFDCYIDGQFEASVSISDYSGMSTSAPGIGAPPCCTDFKGFLDDVKIYPYARSATQIKTDYASRGSVKGTSASFGNQDPNKSLSQGLIGYWKMDEAAADSCTGSVNDSCDSSGNGNDGAWNADATSAAGKFGNGVTFDGADDYVSTNLDVDTLDAKTFSAWIYRNSTATWDGFVLNAAAFDSNKYSGIQGYNSRLSLYQATGTGSSTLMLRENTGTLPLNEWFHVTGTIDKSTGFMRIYVNGKVVKESYEDMSDLTFYDTGGTIDIAGGPTSFTIDGKMDEVRVYNRALSPREVRALYNWAPGPVGHWKMDENTGTSTTYDSSTNGNNGTIDASMTESDWVRAKFGSALEFDGVDDEITVTDSTSLSPTHAVTVGAWIKMDALPGDPGKDDFFGGVQKDGGHSGFGNYGFRISSSDKVQAMLAHGSEAGELTSITSGATLVKNTWYYISMTYDKSKPSFKLYIDGVLETESTSYSQTLLDSAGSFLIGSGDNRKFSGIIDDVRVYNYARTSGQIVEDMNAGHPLGGSPIGSQVAYWKFDEGYGTTATDSINSKTVTLNDDTAYTNDGKIGKALTFDGTDDYASRTDDNDLDLRTDSFTASAWVKQPTPTGSPKVITQKGAATSVAPGYWFAVQSSGKVELYISDGSSYIVNNLQSTFTVNNDAWNHVAFTWNPNIGAKIYIDGVLENEYAVTTTVDINDTSTFKIGGYTSAGYTTNGEIDEVKIYRTALTTEEVLIDMNQSSSVVMGALSTASDGTTASFSSDRSYCPPGDTTASCGPVAEWKLDEKTSTSAYDTSDNGKTGTLTNSPSWSTGKIGSAVKFDGSSNYVNLPSLTTTTAPYTIEMWFKPQEIDRVQTLLDLNGGNYPRFNLYANNKLLAYAGAEKYRYGTKVFNSNDLNKWWHVVFVVADSSSLDNWKVYINGVDDTGTPGANTGTYYEPTTSGYIAYGQGYFNGSIDNVRIYNYARTPAQIAWDYNRGKPVGHWKLDACQDTTAYDSSDNSNNGTITAGDTSGSNDSVGTCSSGAGDEMWDNGTTGKRNYSLDFDGTNDQIEISDPSGGELDFGTGNYTTSLWFKTSSGSRMWLLHKGAGGAPRYFVELFTSTITRCALHTTSEENYMTHTGSGYRDGQWHHLACIYDRDGAQEGYLYLDGKLMNTDDISTNDGETISNSSSLFLGGNQGSSLPFDGQLDDVQIFNYALTSQQIKTLYNSGALFFGPTTGSP